jgi:hypothetical protein
MKIFELIALKKLLKEISDNLNVRGGRGYGVGHPYPKPVHKPPLGKSEYDDDEEQDNLGKKVDKPVKISRAFKK